MSQHEINQQEWSNPQNWSDAWIGFYFSKRDTRVWVPKRLPSLGWTLNLGRPAGAWWMLGILVALPLTVAAVAIAAELAR